MSEGKKPSDVPNINQLRQMAATAGRKSTVASTPKDPKQETYMGQSIGAKPVESAAGAGGEAPGMVNIAAPRRRRDRGARAPLDIDPSELAKFNLPGAAPPPEKTTSVSGLMATSPEPEEKEPSPPKHESPVPEEKPAESPKPKEEEKVPSPLKPVPSPKAEEKPKMESPKPAVPSPKPAVPLPKPEEKPTVEASPKPTFAAAALKPEKAVSPAAAGLSAADQKKLTDCEVYDKICQKLVPGKEPSPMVLIGYIDPMRQQLPSLQDQVQKLQSQIEDLSISLKKREDQITELQGQVVETEKKAAAAISEGTSKALEGVVINDEDVNKLRGAFEEHMKNYQSSLDQFQEFFDKITADLDSTFKELGIDEKEASKSEGKEAS